MLPSFDRIGPQTPLQPVIVSVPHAGRAYAPAWLEACRFSADRLISLEDRHADLLAKDVWQAGYSGLLAHTPRAVIDLNRAEHDMDPAMLTSPMWPSAILSIKARGGLGLVPRRTMALGDLWTRRFTPAEIETRLTEHHRPYHAALEALLKAARAQFGGAVLLDIHSMPPLAASGDGPAPQIVIGNRFGRSCDGQLSDIAGAIASAAGYHVAFNAPYAGGHILERHSAPNQGIHGLQIEVDRTLYLDEALAEPGAGCGPVAQMIASLAQALAGRIMDLARPMAAE